MRLEQISAEETRLLRHKILRPHQTLAECVYPGDEDALSFHVGAFVEKELVCIASFFPQTSERLRQKRQYRLRGMGTLPEFQGRGIGAAVLKEGERIATQRSFDLVWCNARTSAFKYYVKQGYTAFDDIFEIEGIGPHKVMYKAL